MATLMRRAVDEAFANEPSVRILHIEDIAAGDFLLPSSQRQHGADLSNAPKISNSVVVVKMFVRTTGTAPDRPHPTAGTDIGMEIWFPSAQNWNGRIRAQVQGGFAGDFRVTSKDHFSMRVCSDLQTGQIASDLDYVVACTDGGHVADSFENLSYLMNDDGSPNREGWKNIAWQATHLLALKTKELVKAYYGRPPTSSYLFGCSTGGRAAYHSAQKFPEDFDGILIGCPSITQSLLFPSLIHPHIVVQNDLNGEYFTNEQLDMVSKKALAMGDTAVTGRHDGYVTDWEHNTYDPSKDPSILSVADGGCCGESYALSLAQCLAINKIWYGPTIDGQIPDPCVDNGAGPHRSKNQLWWGKIRGTRISFAQKPRVISGSHLALVYGDSSLAPPECGGPSNRNSWTRWSHQEFAQAMLKCREMDSQFEQMDADDPDLRPIQQAGKKIMVYHGLADDGVAPQSAVNYWLSSAKITGGQRKTQEFHRLFLIPGMGHCVRSRGCVGNATLPIPSLEELFSYLVEWVEEGRAPDSIIARSVDGTTSRPVCMFPGVVKYDGVGNTRLASSFTCAQPMWLSSYQQPLDIGSSLWPRNLLKRFWNSFY